MVLSEETFRDLADVFTGNHAGEVARPGVIRVQGCSGRTIKEQVTLAEVGGQSLGFANPDSHLVL